MIADQRLEYFCGDGTPLVFAHANGYPAASYRRFLNRMPEHYEVYGYSHRPLWNDKSEPVAPIRANWSVFAQDLVDTLRQWTREPVWMMGHSLGAVVSLLAVVREPSLFRGLILIDPVFVPMRQALLMKLTPSALLRRTPLIRKTLGRPARFDNVQAAFDFHRGKRVFTRFSDEALWDYIYAGTRTVARDDTKGDRGCDDAVELVWSPEWEAAVYLSVPLVWPHLRRLQLPTLGLRGEDSDILTAAALQRWQQLQPSAQLLTCAGGHLLPLEFPERSAAHVIDFLQRSGG